jgi:hypothetical protein
MCSDQSAQLSKEKGMTLGVGGTEGESRIANDQKFSKLGTKLRAQFFDTREKAKNVRRVERTTV